MQIGLREHRERKQKGMERISRPEGDTSSAQPEKKKKKRRELGPDQKPLIDFLDQPGEIEAFRSGLRKNKEDYTNQEKAVLHLYNAANGLRGHFYTDEYISKTLQEKRKERYYVQAFSENIGSSTTSTSGGRDNTVDFDLNEMP